MWDLSFTTSPRGENTEWRSDLLDAATQVTVNLADGKGQSVVMTRPPKFVSTETGIFGTDPADNADVANRPETAIPREESTQQEVLYETWIFSLDPLGGGCTVRPSENHHNDHNQNNLEWHARRRLVPKHRTSRNHPD
jgi:hypothetical protein